MRHIAELAQRSASGGFRSVPLQALAELAKEGEPALDLSARSTLQQRLAALDATVVEYAAGRDEMFAFVIDGEHIRTVRLTSRNEIAAAAARLYEQLRNPEAASSDVQRAARSLAGLALWPVAPYVTGSRVIVVPDDSLHTVPLSVLPWSSAPDAPLVVQRVELSVAPSTLFLTRAHGKSGASESTPRLELIGDPVFQAADWQRECSGDGVKAVAAHGARDLARAGSPAALPQLPGSRKEVLTIAQLARRSLPASRVHTHLGCEATPTALRKAAAANPALLHIATHGYVDAYRPRLSALELTRDASANGGAASFGLLDILNMKIEPRLVVLSACDTSRGRLLPGEGVLGPAQAFLQAGAHSVIASYWRIADADTAAFMQTFYRYLLADHLTAAAALRHAQLDALRDGRAHEWAAFTLYGQLDTSL
jgi:CHAT domain-containing protein